jgi:purine-binding chemotaxis protein CheW
MDASVSSPRDMTANSSEDQSTVLSIEDFAASIAASLAGSAQPDTGEVIPGAHELAALSFRDRVRLRMGIAHLLVFRVGRELFGVELITVEEALDMPPLHRLPEMPESMLGVFTLRGALISVFTPESSLGLPCVTPATVVVFCGGDRRVALATDDVDDVMVVDLRAVRDAPGARVADDALLGIVHRQSDLIALLDSETLIGAHRGVKVVPPPAQEETA